MKIEITNIIYDEDFCGEFSVEEAMEIINEHPTECVIEFVEDEIFVEMSDEDKKSFIKEIIYDNGIIISIGSFDYEVLVDDEEEHIYDGSGDYLCDICNDPVNTEDWCFTCNSYVHIHHINEK